MSKLIFKSTEYNDQRKTLRSIKRFNSSTTSMSNINYLDDQELEMLLEEDSFKYVNTINCKITKKNIGLYINAIKKAIYLKNMDIEIVYGPQNYYYNYIYDNDPEFQELINVVASKVFDSFTVNHPELLSAKYTISFKNNDYSSRRINTKHIMFSSLKKLDVKNLDLDISDVPSIEELNIHDLIIDTDHTRVKNIKCFRIDSGDASREFFLPALTNLKILIYYKKHMFDLFDMPELMEITCESNFSNKSKHFPPNLKTLNIYYTQGMDGDDFI